MYARPPSATAPSRCRAWCGASPAAVECDARASRANRGRIIAAIAEHADRPAPGPTTFALQARNGIDQGQCFLRVISIGAGQADRERDTLSITDQMPFAPSLGAVGRIRTCLRSAT